MSDVIRILLADDHPVVRDGLTMMLSTQPDFEVVEAVDNGLAVIKRGEALRPHIVLLDLEMPKMDGIETLRQLKIHCPDVRVIVFTAFDTDDRIVEAIQAGAKGYLLKGAPRADLFAAIRSVHQGEMLLQPIVASKLMGHISQQGQKVLPEKLTERELEVLTLMADGKANKDIATTLIITERTVKFHVSAILAKLDASNRTEAVSIAVQHGLVSLT